MILLASLALALPFFAERFDNNALPAEWKSRVVESTGGGEASKVSFDGGQLVVTNGKNPRKFTGVTRKFELRSVEWLQVQARVTTVDIDTAAAAAPGAVCDVVLRFDGGTNEPARPCRPRADGEPYTRFVQVPSGARDVEFAMYSTVPGQVRFDDILLEAVTVTFKTQNRGHYTYYWQGGDAFRDDNLVANDDLFDKTVALLGTGDKTHIDVWKYPDVATLAAYTGYQDESYVEGDVLHTTQRTDARGIVGMLARAWGTPSPALADGLPVHVLGEWDDREPRTVTRRLVGEGRCPSLAALLDAEQYAGLGSDRVLVAGALVSWIVETRGADGLKAVYGAANAASALEAATGKKLADVEAAFRAWL